MDDFLIAQNIPVDDMGFLYGFNLFETFLISQNSSVFLLDKHLDRMYASMDFFDFNFSIEKEELKSALLKYIHSNLIKNKVLRVSVSCGNKLKDIKSSLALSLRDNPIKSRELPLRQYKLCISKLIKNETSIIARHKTANYLENYLESVRASKAGFDDALFLNTQSHIAETTRCNIFFVSAGVLFTPDVSCGILPGIIRDWVIELVAGMGIQCVQGSFDVEMLARADEIFVTNSVVGIMPVYGVQDMYVNTSDGHITKMLMNEYRNTTHPPAPSLRCP